jgi:hypothetical protein
VAANVERFRRPEVIFADLLKGYAQGELASGRSLHRAVVLAVDPDGGALQSRSPGQTSVPGVSLDGSSRSYQSVVGPTNPRNSVKAMLIGDGVDAFRSEDEARVFWPMFPPDQMTFPVAPGEHVYVIFEDSFHEHGLWISRIPGHDDPNFMPGSQKLESERTTGGPKKLNSLIDREDVDDSPRYRTDDRSSVGSSQGKDLNSLFGD